MEGFFVERITDITNDLCDYVDRMSVSEVMKQRGRLVELYNYHNSNHHIYPLTNWHTHRLRCMSCIASKLQDKVKIWECHFMILQYFLERCRCECHCKKQKHIVNGVNHDFYHRDSLNYFVYGSQALANACLYLQPFTKYNYNDIFKPIMSFLSPYLNKSKSHIEYVNSEIDSDKEKPEYKKPWDPSYASTFLRILKDLRIQF